MEKEGQPLLGATESGDQPSLEELNAMVAEGLEQYELISQSLQNNYIVEESKFDQIIRLMSEINSADMIGSRFSLTYGIHSGTSMLGYLKGVSIKILGLRSINNN